MFEQRIALFGEWREMMDLFEFAIVVLIVLWAFATLGYFLVSLERRKQWACEVAEMLQHLPNWPFV